FWPARGFQPGSEYSSSPAPRGNGLDSFERRSCRLRSRPHVELRQHMVDVNLGSRLADPESLGNLLIRKPSSDQPQYFAFAWCKWFLRPGTTNGITDPHLLGEP